MCLVVCISCCLSWDRTHWYMRHDSCMHGTRLIHAWNTTHSSFSPDPIYDLCSLIGVCISQKYATSRSAQIFKILFQGFELQDLILRTRVCGTGFIPQHCWVVDFHLTKMVRRKRSVPDLYQLRKGKSKGLASKYFYMIHRGRQIQSQRSHSEDLTEALL